MSVTIKVAPICKVADVPLSQERAFELFTTRMSEWWFHGQGIGAKPYVAIGIEPRTGGRWFERAADGVETQWGDVLEWEPPTRILLAWRIASSWRFDPDLETHLEIKFEALEPRLTRVSLEHRNLDRLGEAGRGMAQAMNSGWGALLQRFVELAIKTEG